MKRKLWEVVLNPYFGSHLVKNIPFRKSRELSEEWDINLIVGDYKRELKDLIDLTPEEITKKIKEDPALLKEVQSNPELSYLLKPVRSAAYLKRKYKLENFPRYKTSK